MLVELHDNIRNITHRPKLIPLLIIFKLRIKRPEPTRTINTRKMSRLQSRLLRFFVSVISRPNFFHTQNAIIHLNFINQSIERIPRRISSPLTNRMRRCHRLAITTNQNIKLRCVFDLTFGLECRHRTTIHVYGDSTSIIDHN